MDSGVNLGMTILDDGSKALSVDEEIAQKDIAKLVAESL
jgi:hypothetical protein